MSSVNVEKKIRAQELIGQMSYHLKQMAKAVQDGLSVSIGIAFCTEHWSEPEEFYKKADIAL